MNQKLISEIFMMGRNLNYTKLASVLGVAFVLVTNAASGQAQTAT